MDTLTTVQKDFTQSLYSVHKINYNDAKDSVLFVNLLRKRNNLFINMNIEIKNSLDILKDNPNEDIQQVVKLLQSFNTNERLFDYMLGRKATMLCMMQPVITVDNVITGSILNSTIRYRDGGLSAEDYNKNMFEYVSNLLKPSKFKLCDIIINEVIRTTLFKFDDSLFETALTTSDVITNMFSKITGDNSNNKTPDDSLVSDQFLLKNFQKYFDSL